jgi:hypothetical protein
MVATALAFAIAVTAWTLVDRIAAHLPIATAGVGGAIIGLSLPLGHRVGDVSVPRLSSTGAVTIAADLTSGGSSVRPDPGSGIRAKGIGDSGRRRSGGRCGSVCASRAREGDKAG